MPATDLNVFSEKPFHRNEYTGYRVWVAYWEASAENRADLIQRARFLNGDKSWPRAIVDHISVMQADNCGCVALISPDQFDAILAADAALQLEAA